jgi:hypothetical protein
MPTSEHLALCGAAPFRGSGGAADLKPLKITILPPGQALESAAGPLATDIASQANVRFRGEADSSGPLPFSANRFRSRADDEATSYYRHVFIDRH